MPISDGFDEPQKVIEHVDLDQPADFVWEQLIDVTKHPQWLDPNSRTQYEPGAIVGEGTWFTRVHLPTGQIVGFQPPQFMKVRAHTEQGAIIDVEYWLEALQQGCRLSVVWGYDARYSCEAPTVEHDRCACGHVDRTLVGNGPLLIPPEAARKHWSECLKRFQVLCG